MILEQIAFSGDCGRINPIEEPLSAVIICPKILFNSKPSTRPNTALKTCIIRIEEKARCAVNCEIASKIRIALAKGYEL